MADRTTQEQYDHHEHQEHGGHRGRRDGDAHLVWVTRTFALNPASIIAVFHGVHGEVEVYLPGHTRQFKEGDLTDDGRAHLLPPHRSSASGR